MQLQLIRNATLRLTYAGHLILIDPYFAPLYSIPSYAGKSPNPMVDLPIPIEKILDGIELVMVSHLHSDHFDSVAYQQVPKKLPLFCQTGDEELITSKKFQQVTPITDKIDWQGIHITRTDGHHGLGYVETQMGNVSGFVFQSPDEPTLYWAGDTVLCTEVERAIQQFKPDVIVIHACGAVWPDESENPQLIVMDAPQALAVCELAPDSTIIATHMEALDHATVSRSDLRAAATAADIVEGRLRIPADGVTVKISRR